MSAHGHGGNPIFKVIGLLLLVAFVVGGVIYFFSRFPIFAINSTDPMPREFQPYELVDPSSKKPTPVPANKSPLDNTKWAWQYTQKNDGTYEAPSDAGNFVLSFAPDKRVSSTTDCNTISGSYLMTGHSLRFEPFIMTLMACPGQTMQATYVDELSKVVLYSITGDQLQFTLSGSEGVMVFSKRYY